jgi:hypothetical protein
MTAFEKSRHSVVAARMTGSGSQADATAGNLALTAWPALLARAQHPVALQRVPQLVIAQ